jgi:hypothetical protein
MDGPSKYPYFSTSIAALATISLPNKSSKALRTLQDSASAGKDLIPKKLFKVFAALQDSARVREVG